MRNERPRQAVILAGGRGTRLQPITDRMPKAMVPFHGKPFLGHMVDLLREQGIADILMLLGYRAEDIIEHFGDGSAYAVDIQYDVTSPEDLTAYRVRHAQDLLDDIFVLLYCDNYWPMRFNVLWRDYERSEAPAQVTVYSNEDSYSRDSVIVDRDGFVRVFDRGRTTPGLKGVEIGYAILRKDAVLPLLPDHQILFEEAVYPPLAASGQLHAHWTRHRYYSVGTHERLPLTEAFLARRPTLLVDRDGVLNERPPRGKYVKHPQDFRWLPGAREALALLANAGWRVVLISNQAGIGRGMMAQSDLEAVHASMRLQAAAAGGRVDHIYVCPHGWDDGCDCRKPRPGLLFRAQRELHLDLTRTYFIGDDERDLEAATAAGCRAALVGKERPLLEIARRLLQDTLKPDNNTGG